MSAVKDLNNSSVNVAFAGLTATGKTTHAKILANQLGFEYVSATETILEIIGIKKRPDRVWFTNYEEIEKAREGDRVDVELETRMQDLATKRGGLILDTWAMAWIYNGVRPMVRVWIDSDEPSRTRKCYVSQDDNKALDLQGCRELINQKDTETRDKFLVRLAFDLFNDRDRYDIILDNTLLIPETSDECALEGIAKFEPVVFDSVDYIIKKKVEPGFDADNSCAAMLINRHSGMIKRLGQVSAEDLK